jgi:hypothetical protein
MRRDSREFVLKRRAAVWLVVLSLIVPAVVYLRELLAVDTCLDRGGSFDYSAGRCDFNQNHPFVPFHERHGILLGGSGTALLIGAATAARSRRQRWEAAA